jgi:hypothetical protein
VPCCVIWDPMSALLLDHFPLDVRISSIKARWVGEEPAEGPVERWGDGVETSILEGDEGRDPCCEWWALDMLLPWE